jgi:predicted HTH domain antitoxin
MTVTVDIPEAVTSFIGPAKEVPRRMLESIVADLYRDEKISRGKVREILGLSWHEGEEFLARKGCFYHYSLEDLESDRQTLAKLLPD